MVEFIFESAPFASAHASTIVETRDGLVAAWFGGTREGANDVGIWLSRRVGGTWTAPVEVATGVQPDGMRFPTWNPVLFELRKGELALFYKVGPSPREWWGMVRTSADEGRTWSDARRLPDGILGPIKNKPVRLTDGTIIAPSSTETPQTPSTWRVHFERSRDGGATWSVSRPPARAGRHSHRRHPAKHPDARRRPTAGDRPHALGAPVRNMVRRSRANVDAGDADRAAQSKRRHRRCHIEGRPPPSCLQSHAKGPDAAERRHHTRRTEMGRRHACSRASLASTRIRRSSRRLTASSTSPTRGGGERIKHVVIDPMKLKSNP